MNVVALLESMWGWRGCCTEGDVIRFFRIDPENLSGRRLYRIVGNHSLLVTNSCRESQATANSHGTPDPIWVADNLRYLQKQRMDALLVCGRIAKETYDLCGFNFPRVLFINHPAWRRWSNVALDKIRVDLDALLRSSK